MISEYVHEIEESLGDCESAIGRFSDRIKRISARGNRVWVLGNGGSLAIAQHFAQDLLKLGGIRAQALTCPSVITAYSNDESFEMSFYKPLLLLAEPEDLILIFSCSGKSRNYIEFVSSFGFRCDIVSVVGTDGGFLADKSIETIHIKSQDYQVCETAFCVVADLILRNLTKE